MDSELLQYPGLAVEVGRLHGQPTLGESRVPAQLVADCLDSGETAEEIAYNYTLPLKIVLEFKTYRDMHQLVLGS